MSAKTRWVKAVLVLPIVVLALGGCTGSGSTQSSTGPASSAPPGMHSDRDTQGAAGGGGY